ncbi:MAG: type II secretion system F family protein [Candidatus Saganbacteria bacterium]|nr:type II secretion system F family protein [Candidatus Saganbacteria bacterium]
MTNFSYKARDSHGVLASGTMEAEDSKGVALQLEKQGYTPISITTAESGGMNARFEDWLAPFMHFKPQDLIVFTRQLSSILEAGVPLVEGLDAVQEQVSNKKFREVLLAVKKEIESGSSFSEALKKHKDVFSPLIYNMVQAGEKAGILDEVLDRVSDLLEKELETKAKIKAATRYPMIVLIALCLAFVILVTVVIPKFAGFFGAFNAQLPLPTRILMWINYVVSNYWYWFILAIVILGYSFKKMLDTEKGRYAWDRLMLKTPIFGSLFLKIYLSRFCRMLAAMLRSGIPILDALTISADTVENKVITGVILGVRDDVSRGKNLAGPMKASHLFPPIATSMVAIGEKAGTLEDMLFKVAKYFDREADYTIDNLTPLLEPILICGLGMILLVFALGIFLPMWELIKVFKTH